VGDTRLTAPASRTSDVVIVGGGIVGAACAYSLAQAGRSVTVLERDFPGGGSTAAAMGHVVAMDDSEAQLALTKYSRDCWEDLALILPPSCADRASGTTWIAASEEELDLVHTRAIIYRAHGIVAEVLDPQDLAELEPNVREGMAGALHIPHDRVIYPPAAAAWLLARAKEHGATALTGVQVLSIGARSVSTNLGTFTCDIVINAAGAHAAELTPGLPIVPRKGHLIVTERYPGFCNSQLIELSYLASAHSFTPESVAFNVHPRPNGQMIIGSSRELVGWDRTINRTLVARMISRACDYLPKLSECQAIRTWIGFRPATPDSLPLIGSWPEVDGLWIAAGHEGLGITTAIGTARILAALIEGAEPPISALPFAPTRSLVEAHA
jgi:D-hydroxyproline dehydrogenase subunit beta